MTGGLGPDLQPLFPLERRVWLRGADVESCFRVSSADSLLESLCGATGLPGPLSPGFGIVPHFTVNLLIKMFPHLGSYFVMSSYHTLIFLSNYKAANKKK